MTLNSNNKSCKRESLPVTTVILAGGEGKRLGLRKLFLNVNGKSMIEEMVNRVVPFSREIFLSCSDKDAAVFKTSGVAERCQELIDKIVVDSTPGKGPLEGLFQGLKNASSRWVFLVGCDMPSLMESVVRRIWSFRRDDTRVLVPLLNGFREPLHAFYAMECLPAIEHALKHDVGKVTSFFDSIAITEVKEECLQDIPGYSKSFMNINTRSQLDAWQKSHGGL